MLEDRESLARPAATVARAPNGIWLGWRPSGLRRVAHALLTGLLSVAAAQAAAQQQELPLMLVHRFTIEQPLSWREVQVKLEPGSWRVGSPDGPVASAWQLRMALGGLSSIVVGGCCGASVDGSTTYPCGFTLRGLDLSGLQVDRDPISASPAPTTSERTPDDAVACARDDAHVEAGSVQHGAMRFAGIRPRLHNPGNHARALGGTLHFEFRGIPNELHPSRIDRASGLVILISSQRGRAS